MEKKKAKKASKGPKAPDYRTNLLGVRLTNAELEAVKKDMGEHGYRSQSAYLRYCLGLSQ